LGKAPGMARSMSMKLPPFQHLVEERSTERDAWLAAALAGPAEALLHLLQARPADCNDENSLSGTRGRLCVRWLLLPARGDRRGGALVPALRAVLP